MQLAPTSPSPSFGPALQRAENLVAQTDAKLYDRSIGCGALTDPDYVPEPVRFAAIRTSAGEAQDLIAPFIGDPSLGGYQLEMLRSAAASLTKITTFFDAGPSTDKVHSWSSEISNQARAAVNFLRNARLDSGTTA